MRLPTPIVALVALCAATVLTRAADEVAIEPWPAISAQQKPWTRWWWPGSAVDRANLTHQLEQFAAAGIGGVEITPIYGAKGYESRYVTYLSPQWMEMLTHAAKEAQRLGLGVDMATGTGWPFGGPWIDEAHASEKMTWADGRLIGVPTGMKVKRAAPGGEGLVVDPYSVAAIQSYLAPFDRAFAEFPRGLVRSQFHDSFEYYDASWTPDFAAAFRQRNGYDIQRYADALAGRATVDRDTLARLKSDYRDTIAELHLGYLRAWVTWSHQHQFLVRNQSHGAPGNLLDLYANADIAETEVFGSTPFPIPGLRRDPADIRQAQDLPDSLMIRMASSASHVAGHRLTSSETGTWLREHWKVTLSDLKPEIDRLFADGINHVFYHGTAYSPTDAPWPGWYFYASTQFNPNNPWWDDSGALNAYVARVQSVLQRGEPDNGILLYWPIEDVWDDPEGLTMQLTVHNVTWLSRAPVGRIAAALLAGGYSFDYISDAQLGATNVEDHQLRTPGGRYRLLIVPPTRRMPVQTLSAIARLANAGACVYFAGSAPDVPGLGNLETRRAELGRAWDVLRERARAADSTVTLAPEWREDAPMPATAVFEQAKINREGASEAGLRWIRRREGDQFDYWFANLGPQQVDGWVNLGTSPRSGLLLDPLTGTVTSAAFRRSERDETAVYLQLAPGESVLFRTTERATDKWPSRYVEPSGAPLPIGGPWRIEFLRGGPALPQPIDPPVLKSWTELGGPEAERFAGTARYHAEFTLSATAADDWLLDLGDVRESARVRVNGQLVGTAWSLPFRLRIGPFVHAGVNTLDLDVTNLAANRIRDLDRRGVAWKIMREINLVDVNYRPFNAANWPITPSGLLGPVTITPLRRFDPR